MARIGRNLVAIVLFCSLGAGAYATQERWLPTLKTQLASLAAPKDGEAQGQRANGRGNGGGRRGGRFGGAQQGPIAVLTTPAKSQDVPVTVTGVGTAMPTNTVTVRSQVDGQLTQVLFKEGQDVKKGDILARLDDRSYKAQLDQAVAKKAQDQASLDNAKHDLERYINLAASNSVTKQQVDTQRSTVAQAEALLRSDDASIASVQVTLGYTSIGAPIDGRTGLRNVDEGNLVHASDTSGIVTISQIKPIAVVFSVPQQNLAAINKASSAGSLPIDVLNGNGDVIDHGQLQVVDNQIDQTTGTVKLKASVPNEALALWPGTFVTVRLQVTVLKDAVVVPTAAVQRGPDGTFVYRFKDGTAALQKVDVGQQDDQQAVVTGGLAVGDKVITTGFVRLTDGAKVEVADAARPATPDAAPPAAATPPAADGPQAEGTPGKGQRRHQRRNAGEGDSAAVPAPPP